MRSLALPSSKTSQFSSLQSLSRVQLFVIPWTAARPAPWTVARQASLPITNSGSLLKLMSIESVISSNHLIFCCHLLLLLENRYSQKMVYKFLYQNFSKRCSLSLISNHCPQLLYLLLPYGMTLQGRLDPCGFSAYMGAQV